MQGNFVTTGGTNCVTTGGTLHFDAYLRGFLLWEGLSRQADSGAVSWLGLEARLEPGRATPLGEAISVHTVTL